MDPKHNRKTGSAQQEINKTPSPSSMSQKSSLSRQGTMRSSHRRKNSMSQGMLQDRSPGRKSPSYLGLSLSDDRKVLKSPTTSLGRRSPIGGGLLLESPGNTGNSGFNLTFGQKSPTNSIHVQDRRSPLCGLIPPITISNPSETCGISLKSMDSGKFSPGKHPSPQSPLKDILIDKKSSPVKSPCPSPTNVPEKKEKTSVMREILAFVRKPSKKVSTRTSRFAAAFSKTETDPILMRQSTFSSTPNTSSRASRIAMTKQMSDVGFEPKISMKLKSVGSKMSLRLRRSTDIKVKDKRSSGDEISDMESSEMESQAKSLAPSCSGSMSETVFEMESVFFEKVGQSHKKHEEKIVEEDSPVLVEGLLEKPKSLYDELKRSIETLFENKEPIYENIAENKREQEVEQVFLGHPLNTIAIDIIPPSRRASFDPPRSPFAQYSLSGDTDHEIPSGESFEIVDTDRHQSSFEMDTSFQLSDISRYQSTSYDEQTSSFELLEPDSKQSCPLSASTLQKSNVDLSSIELTSVDPETFQKSSPSGRKSSLETHFDLSDTYRNEAGRSPFSHPPSEKSTHDTFPIGMRALHQQSESHQHHKVSSHHLHRARSPLLSNQTSSNFSSRDSYDSSSTYESSHPHAPHSFDVKNPFADSSKHHYPLPRKYSHDKTFLCIDKRCNSIFEPRNQKLPPPRRSTASSSKAANNSYLNTDTSSGSEFEGPSPRRALSASPKHTFTFRIVMKKVESSPEDLCPCPSTAERRQTRTHQRERHRRGDSRRRKNRFSDIGAGKSF